MPVEASDHPRIPPVVMGKTNVPCKRHRKSGVANDQCLDCQKDVTVLRHTDHARKRHVDVPVYRKVYKNDNKYSPSK